MKNQVLIQNIYIYVQKYILICKTKEQKNKKKVGDPKKEREN